MGKHLILLRHGKSDWKADFVQDHERPLSKRGRKAAELVGCLLAGADQIPDVILTSSARRAVETVEIAVQKGTWDSRILTSQGLYESDPESVIQELNQLPEELDRCLLVGHEPTWSSLLQDFIGPCNVRFPTAAMAGIDLDIESWRDIGAQVGQLQWFLPPRFFTDSLLGSLMLDT